MKKFYISLMFLIIAAPAGAVRDGFIIDSPRILGMGGAGVAVQGVDNALFLNPALLAARHRTQFRVLDVRAVVNDNAFHQYGFYNDHQDEFESFDDMTDIERNRFYQDLLDNARERAILGVDGMAPLVLVKPGFSIGLFEKTRVDFNLQEGAAAIPVVRADAVAEAEAIVGYANSMGELFGSDLCWGINAKYLYRAVSRETRAAPSVEAMENVRVYRGGTVTFDVGLLLNSLKWSFGAAIYDVNWPEIDWRVNEETPDGFTTPSSIVAASGRIGVAHRPSVNVSGIFEDVQIAFDIVSPMSDEMARTKKISFGAESLLLGFMRIRGGFNQGYPTFGGQIGLAVLKLEYAYGGEALGMRPGQLDSYSHMVAVGLGWGF
jgi:hypothetical protein